jgi:hypothetical protein
MAFQCMVVQALPGQGMFLQGMPIQAMVVQAMSHHQPSGRVDYGLEVSSS